jgi:hypothetical protein
LRVAHAARLKLIADAIETRNTLTHSPLRVEGGGDVYEDDGQIGWSDGEIIVGDERRDLQHLHADLIQARNATVAVVEIIVDVDARLNASTDQS